MRVIKLIVYAIIFCSVFSSSLIAKCIVLFSVAQLKEEKYVEYCDHYSGISRIFFIWCSYKVLLHKDLYKLIQNICINTLDYHKSMNATISKEGKTIWTWYIIFMFLVPECFTILCTIWNAIFKKTEEMPRKRSIIILFFLETLHPIGLALLVFYSFPKINSVDVPAICSCICFIPAILSK